MHAVCRLGCFLFLVGSSLSLAQEEKKSERIPDTIRSYVVTDNRYDLKSELNRTGQFHCWIGEHGLSPVLAVFSRKLPEKSADPLMKLIAKQEEIAQKYKSSRLGAFVLFLTLTKDFPDDPDRERQITAIASAAKEAKVKQVTVGLTEATLEENEKSIPNPQLTKFQIANEDEITVFLYNRLQVIHRWKFTKDKPPTEEDLKTIATSVDQLLGSKKR